MKKWLAVCLLLAGGLVAFPSHAYAGNMNSGDSITDKASDWLATVGKSPEERDVILAQRRADRMAKRFGEAMKSGSEKAGKEMKKMGKNMGDMFNS